MIKMLKRILQPCRLKVVRCASTTAPSSTTALYDLHLEKGGKMVNFGGFQLPVQYEGDSIVASHQHTRASSSLFDVSHMLQTKITGANRQEFLESICTTDVQGMSMNSCALSLFTDRHTGGILDDLIITKTEDHLFLVSNASMRSQDMNIMSRALEYFKSYGKDVAVQFFTPSERSLIALQGPKSSAALEPLIRPGSLKLKSLFFMRSALTELRDFSGHEVRVSRCGYTGEDGFEISVPSSIAEDFAKQLLDRPGVKLAGLGARDSLRLEAGLCLYGNDIDSKTTPLSAGLMWTIGRRRRDLQDYPGARLVEAERKEGSRFKRVGLISVSKASAPMRQGAKIFKDDTEIGHVTSGCPSPSLGYNIAMAYVQPNYIKPDTELTVKVRSNFVPVKVTKMPFVSPNYYVPGK